MKANSLHDRSETLSPDDNLGQVTANEYGTDSVTLIKLEKENTANEPDIQTQSIIMDIDKCLAEVNVKQNITHEYIENKGNNNETNSNLVFDSNKAKTLEEDDKYVSMSNKIIDKEDVSEAEFTDSLTKENKTIENVMRGMNKFQCLVSSDMEEDIGISSKDCSEPEKSQESVNDTENQPKQHKNFLCKLCFIIFSSFRVLKEVKKDLDILKLEFTQEDLIYECTKCPLKFLEESIVSVHNTLIHSGKYLQCDICTRIISVKKKSDHKLTHGDRTIECKLCYTSFNKIGLRNSYLHL